MDPESWIQIIAVVVLMFLAALSAASETSISSINENHIRLLANKGNSAARRVLKLIDLFDYTISALLISNNLTHILVSTIVTVMVTRKFGTGAVSIATIILTLVVFFFAELLPKNIAKKYPETFSLMTAGILMPFVYLCMPFSFLLSRLSQWVSKLVGSDGNKVTEDELNDLLEATAEESSLEEEKTELLQSAITFSERTVADILSPRVDLDAIDCSWSCGRILEYIQKVKHSFIPVYQDNIDNIIGILPYREYIREYIESGSSEVDLKAIMASPFFIHQSTYIDDLMKIMQENNINMAVVTDDNGGVQGIVTMEDIMEEVMGEIWDEDDDGVEPFVRLDKDSFDVDASMNVEDCFSEIGIDDYEEDEVAHKSLANLAYASFEQIPSEGDRFRRNGLEFTITRMAKNRILRIHIDIVKDGKEDEEA